MQQLSWCPCLVMCDKVRLGVSERDAFGISNFSRAKERRQALLLLSGLKSANLDQRENGQTQGILKHHGNQYFYSRVCKPYLAFPFVLTPAGDFVEVLFLPH